MTTNTTLPSAARDPSPAFAPVLGTFAAFGLMYGVWQVLLADLALDLRLSTGALGAALSVGALASIPVMLVGGRLADRFGPARLVAAAALGLAAALVGVAFAPTYPALLALLILFTGSSGLYDVAINTLAVHHGRAARREVLPAFHAGFSGFAALGALLAGLLLAGGVPFRLVYLPLAVAVAAVALLVWRTVPLARPAGPANAAPADADPAARSVYRHPTVLLLAALALMAFFGEGAVENWSTLYLREHLHVPAAVGAAGVAVFHAAMLLGRLGAARLLPAVGRRTWLLLAGALGAVGTALATGSALAVPAVAGLLLVGLALAAVAPVAFSLAGDAAPRQVGAATSVITTIGYFGFLVGPSVIGGVAQFSSLRTALMLVGVASAVILALAWRLRVPR